MKGARLHRWIAGGALAYGAATVFGQAPAACPWLTQGTAARVLGGNVSVAVPVSDAGEGVCSFVRSSDATTSLRIEVSKAPLPPCGADAMKLKGIGNEAVRCALPAAGGHALEKIAGRVRDRYFSVTLSYWRKAAASKAEDPTGDELEQAAESVAGNLF